MLVKTHCAAVMGLEAVAVTIEVNIARGTMLHMSGLADTAVRESIDRIRAGLLPACVKGCTYDALKLVTADDDPVPAEYSLVARCAVLSDSQK